MVPKLTLWRGEFFVGFGFAGVGYLVRSGFGRFFDDRFLFELVDRVWACIATVLLVNPKLENYNLNQSVDFIPRSEIRIRQLVRSRSSGG